MATTPQQSTLPAIAEVAFVVQTEGGAWCCYVTGRGTTIPYGLVTAASPEKAVRKAIEVLEGKRPAATLRPPIEEPTPAFVIRHHHRGGRIGTVAAIDDAGGELVIVRPDGEEVARVPLTECDQ